MSSDPREDVALFGYRIVAEATNPRLKPAERGRLVRELASRAYEHPDGSSWTYTRGTPLAAAVGVDGYYVRIGPLDLGRRVALVAGAEGAGPGGVGLDGQHPGHE